MKGDFNQWLAEAAKQQSFINLLQQQGRPISAADLAAQTQLKTSQLEDALQHVIGPSGTPKFDNGFQIGLDVNGELEIGAGSFFVDGLRVVNPAPVAVHAQSPFLKGVPGADTLEEGKLFLVYLDVWRDTVSASEDSLLLDPALEGRDTSVAEKARWLVGVMPLSEAGTDAESLQKAARLGVAVSFDALLSTGHMRADAPLQVPPEEDDCLIAPDAGYLSLDDYLYRVEIVEAGDVGTAKFVWSRVNGSVVSSLRQGGDGGLYLEADRINHELGFSLGDTIEVTTQLDRLLGRPGRMGTLNSSEGEIPADLLQTAENPGGVFDPNDVYLVRRWDHKSDTGKPLDVTDTALELEFGIMVAFAKGQYQVGDFWCIRTNAASGSIVWPLADQTSGGFLPSFGWGRRRVPLAVAEFLDGGDGIGKPIDVRPLFPSLTVLNAQDVAFDSSACRLDAQTVQEAIEALCQHAGGDVHCDLTASTAKELQDVVASLLPPRNSVTPAAPTSPGSIVRGGDFELARPGMPPRSMLFRRGSSEEAMEAEPAEAPASLHITDFLERSGSAGSSGVLTAGGAVTSGTRITTASLRAFLDAHAARLAEIHDLRAADLTGVAVLKRSRSATICLKRGVYDLKDTLLFKDMDFISIIGSGRDTLVRAPKGLETAIRFENCGYVRMENMSVIAASTSEKDADPEAPNATVDVEAAEEAWFERLHIETGDGQPRHAAGLSVKAAGQADVTVRDCEILPGMGQVGVQIFSPRRAVIENNRVGPPFREVNQITNVLKEKDGYFKDWVGDLVWVRPQDSATGALDASISAPAIDPREPASVGIDHSAFFSGTPINFAGTDLEVRPEFEKGLLSFKDFAGAELAGLSNEERFDFLTLKFSEAMRSDDGLAMVSGRVFDGFSDMRAAFFKRVKVHAYEGIAVGGQNIGEVIIRQNEIFNCVTSVRIAEKSSKTLEKFKWEDVPANVICRRVLVENNRITQHVPTGGPQVYGIFLSHFDAAVLGANDISLDWDGAPGDNLEAIGIWAYGRRGRQLNIRDNSITGNSNSIVVLPGAPQVPFPNAWIVAFNAVSGYNDLAADISVWP